MDAEDITMRIKSSTALRQATSIVTSDGIDRNYDIAVSIKRPEPVNRLHLLGTFGGKEPAVERRETPFQPVATPMSKDVTACGVLGYAGR